MTESGGEEPGVPIGIAGLGIYVPPEVVSADDLARETGIPAHILIDKFGVRQVHRAGPECHVSDMGIAAVGDALRDAGVRPEDVDLVVYAGSEFKDYIVWSAASYIAHRTGCLNAEAYEIYALCAGSPLALRVVRDMMLVESDLRTVVVVAASKESALVDRGNQNTRFMFNFGDGAGAIVLRRSMDRNRVLGAASTVDGSLSLEAIMPAGGSRQPASEETVRTKRHSFDVPDIGRMRRKLEEVSGPNFLRVIRTALRRSALESVDVLLAVHMKRSMQDWLEAELQPRETVYLEDYGHMQAADQFVALWEARRAGVLREGDTVVLAAAGVGYTWSAAVIRWGER